MTRARTASLVVVVTVVSVALTWWASRSGVGISPDSVTYVAGAHGLLVGQGVVDIDGQALTLFPPGMSVLLALLGWCGLSLADAALIVNLASVAAIVLLSFVLARRALAADAPALAVSALVGLCAPTVSAASMLWTEPAFTAVMLALLALLTRAADRRSIGPLELTLGPLLVWAAVSLRYVGAVLVVVAMAGTWLAMKGRPRRALKALAMGLLAAVGPAALIVRNLVEGDGALGERYPGTQTILGAVQRAIALWGTYVTQVDLGWLTSLAGIVVAVLAGLGLVVMVRRRSPATVVGVFLVIYWAAIWWSQSTTRIDVQSDRLGYPALVPLIVTCGMGMQAVLGRLRARFPSRARGLGLSSTVLVAGFVVIVAVRGAVVATDLGASPRGYAATTISESTLAQAIAAVPKETGIASTDPWLAWWLRQGGIAMPIPPVAPNWPPERTAADLGRLQDAVRAGRVELLVYVNGSDPVLSEADLAQLGLETNRVADLPDGHVSSVTWQAAATGS